MRRAIWNGTVIAESDRCVAVEGNQYFPAEAVNREFLRSSDMHTVCGWKGTANYYDVVVNGEVNANACWFYPEPFEAAARIKGRVAFWKGVQVVDA